MMPDRQQDGLPDAVRPLPARPPGTVSGRWIVLGIVGTGLVLALVGLRYRVFTPARPTPPSSQPVYVRP